MHKGGVFGAGLVLGAMLVLLLLPAQDVATSENAVFSTQSNDVALVQDEGGTMDASREFMCNDGIDNDRDGLVDCDDDQCFGDNACAWLYDGELCDDDIDNDGDGQVDCQDQECEWDVVCQ